MVEEPGCKVIDLQRRAGGVAAGIDTHIDTGRHSVTTASLDPSVQIVGSDPYGTPQSSGILIPTVATTALVASGLPIHQLRYLFLLAKVHVNRHQRARLKGLRQYVDLVGYTDGGAQFFLPVTSPMWRFPDGNISWHVMQYNTVWRETRNASNTDSFMFLDAQGPSLLYQTTPASPTGYSPPNAGRPWGKPIGSDLGNIHDLRYPWRDSQVETELDIPLEMDGDIAVFASVAQHARAGLTLTATQAAAAGPEDRFWSAFTNVQYNRIAASLIIEQESGK